MGQATTLFQGHVVPEASLPVGTSMSRLPRVFTPDLPNHVILRGNDRQDIVLADVDRRRILDDLLIEVRQNDVRIHAYALMTNHVHLMVSADAIAAIPRAIQGLGRRYVPYFNLRHGRVGTLWQGRYRSSIIANERYLYACHRYIEMNPVRAGLVAHPREYRWSSHGFYAGGGEDRLVSPHPCLGWQSGEWPGRKAFIALFDEVASDAEISEIRDAGRRGTALGDQAACRALEARIGRRITPRSAGRRPKDDLSGGNQMEMVV